MANGKLLSVPRSLDSILKQCDRLDGCQVYSALNMESTFLHEDRKVKIVFALPKFTDLVVQCS